MLEIQSLSAGYGVEPVLHDFSASVRPGEVVAVVGPNGAGKTTLIKAASGVLPVQAGKIRVDGKDLSAFSAMERARYLAVVPQARNLPPAFTVWQTVMMGRTPFLGWLGKASPADRNRARWALERTHTQDLSGRRVDELSGGEQQRVLLARALAQDAPILLMDEPTAHLDLKHQSNLLNLTRELAEAHHLAVLMALHDLNLVALYADRVALLVEGRLPAAGTPNEVLTPQRLSEIYQIPLNVITHPDYGTPLVLPDGKVKKNTSAQT
jgi:ABC-type cobalamin/Fe3+-siderophores transport system ATPase subunit